MGALLIEAIWQTKPPTLRNARTRPDYDGLINILHEMEISSSSPTTAESSTKEPENNENTYQFSNGRRLSGESKKCV